MWVASTKYITMLNKINKQNASKNLYKEEWEKFIEKTREKTL